MHNLTLEAQLRFADMNRRILFLSSEITNSYDLHLIEARSANVTLAAMAFCLSDLHLAIDLGSFAPECIKIEEAINESMILRRNESVLHITGATLRFQSRLRRRAHRVELRQKRPTPT